MWSVVVACVACLVCVCHGGAALSGRVLDRASLLPVAYARVQYALPGSAAPFFAFALVNGSYSIPYTTSSPPVITGVDHAQYEYLNGPNSSSVSDLLLSSLNFSNIFPFGSDGSLELLRVQLLWRQASIDLDLVVVTPCGQVTFQTRLRAVGGVSVRIDNDFLSGNGVENVKFLAGLPCGEYQIWVRQVSRNTFFRDNQATVSIYFPNQPTIPSFVLDSNTGTANFRTWHVATLFSRLVDPATRSRTYQFVQQNTFFASQVPPAISPPLTNCVLDSQWCRTIQSSSSFLSFGFFLLLVVSALVA